MSCGLIGREYEYCSDDCWNTSEEKLKMVVLFDSLTDRQVELMFQLLDPEDYCTEFDRWLTYKFKGWDYKNIKAV